MTAGPDGIDGLLLRMDGLLSGYEAAGDPRRHFLATYRRTTVAVQAEIARGGFTDGVWVERWDVIFAGLYLDAAEQWNAEHTAPGPWAVAFDSGQGGPLPPLRHVLLGMNAHVNYDLPQSLLAAITDAEFDDADLVARRAADHAHIDDILVSRVDAEDQELVKVEQPGDRTRLDRLMKPFNQAGTKRFLKEARAKVWRNARLLSAARRQSPEALAGRIAELGDLSTARVADLRAPGQVLIKLAVRGFGVTLSPAPAG